MLSPTSPAAIKPTLRMGDGLPFAGGQGQTAGSGTRKVKIYDLRNEPVRTAEAAATTVVVVPEKKKCKYVATEARIAIKARKQVQTTAPEHGAAAARFKRYKKKWPRNYWDIRD